MYCSNCGKELPNYARFCIYCGHPTALKLIQKYIASTPAGNGGTRVFAPQSEKNPQQSVNGKTVQLTEECRDINTRELV